RDDARGGCEAEARLPAGRYGHRGDLERDQRRRGGAAGRRTAGQSDGRTETPGPHRLERRRRSGSELHGVGAHSGDAQGAEARRADDRPDRSDRAQRGVCGAGDCVHPRAPARFRAGQYLRGRDRAGAPVGGDWSAHPDDPGSRLTPDEVALWLSDDVHRSRPGDRDDRGAVLNARVRPRPGGDRGRDRDGHTEPAREAQCVRRSAVPGAARSAADARRQRSRAGNRHHGCGPGLLRRRGPERSRGGWRLPRGSRQGRGVDDPLRAAAGTGGCEWARGRGRCESRARLRLPHRVRSGIDRTGVSQARPRARLGRELLPAPPRRHVARARAGVERPDGPRRRGARARAVRPGGPPRGARDGGPPPRGAMGGPAGGGGPPGQGSAVRERGQFARGYARSRDRSAAGIVRHCRGAPAHRGGAVQEESLMVRKLNNFDEWIDYFRYWQDSIGLPQGELRNFKFEAKFGDQEVPHIEFGHYKGQRKWPSVMHIPDQRIRDALLNLIVYQGDTEFASVEQQRTLLQHAPSDYDLLSLMRVMTEEMRHGWQMSYLLCAHFGDEGKREAAILLERRADEGERLLGSFKELVDNWLDFF